jgi:hypothetical protein
MVELGSNPLSAEVARVAASLRQHPLFERLRSVEQVRVLMEHHVWAVWDFMSLLKSVQSAIAPVTVPWCPPPDAEAARLINEIVVCEEGDEGPAGHAASHFEIYLEAMAEAGASDGPIRQFARDIAAGLPWPSVLDAAAAPAASRSFVRTTLDICAGSLHGRVAAFTIGREEIIPSMFRGIVAELARLPQPGQRSQLRLFEWYLSRHIALDGDRHGPMADRLFQRICLADERTLAESLAVALRVLQARIALWDAVQAAIA